MGYYDRVTIYDAEKVQEFIERYNLTCEWEDLFIGCKDTFKIENKQYYVVLYIDDNEYWNSIALTNEQDKELDECEVYFGRFHR